MAVSYIGKSSTMASGTGAISVEVAANYASGDLLILLLQGRDATPATPANWTSLGTQTDYYAESYFRICYKTAGSSESAVSISDSGNSTRGLMLAFRGCTATPSILWQGQNYDANLTASGGTTTVDGSMVVCAMGFWNGDSVDTSNFSSWANASLASITQGHDQSDDVGTGGGIAFAYGVDTVAGSVGNTTATVDDVELTAGVIVFVVVAGGTNKTVTQANSATLSSCLLLSPTIYKTRNKIITQASSATLSSCLLISPLDNYIEIERKVGEEGSWTDLVILRALDYTSYTDVGPFDPEESYYYRMRVVEEGVAGDWSVEDFVIYASTAPILSGQQFENYVHLAWSKE